MKKIENNKGITLIELIVVIAIMAVLTASFAVSLTLISRQRVSNAGSSMKSMLQLAQTYSKSKDECVLKIIGQSEGGAEVSIFTYDKDGNEKLGSGPTDVNKNITTQIKYKDKSDPTIEYMVTVSSGVTAEIRFVRSTGGFEAVAVPGQASSISAYPVQIIFTNGEKETTLDLATNTGVITYESQND